VKYTIIFSVIFCARNATKYQITCCQMGSFKVKMHQNRFRRGPRWGSLRRSPRSPSRMGRGPQGTPLPTPYPSPSASRSYLRVMSNLRYTLNQLYIHEAVYQSRQTNSRSRQLIFTAVKTQPNACLRLRIKVVNLYDQ